MRQAHCVLIILSLHFDDYRRVLTKCRSNVESTNSYDIFASTWSPPVVPVCATLMRGDFGTHGFLVLSTSLHEQSTTEFILYLGQLLHLDISLLTSPKSGNSKILCLAIDRNLLDLVPSGTLVCMLGCLPDIG